MRTPSRTRARVVGAAALAITALLAASCTMPGNDEVRLDRRGATIGTSVTTTTVPAGLEVSSEASSGGVLVLTATAATLTPKDNMWLLSLEGVNTSMSRVGGQVNAPLPTGDFFENPGALMLAAGQVNAVLSGKIAGGPNDNIIMSVQSPLAGRGNTATFDAIGVVQGRMDRGLARAGGVAITKKNRTDSNSSLLPPATGESAEKVMTDVALYLDVQGTKVLDECPMVPGTNCPEADLFQSDIVGVNLTGANFEGANLGMATVRNSTFDNVNLNRSQIFRTDATRTSWVEADVRYANMHQITLTDSDLSGLRGKNVNLFRSELDRTTLVNADLTLAALQQVSLHDANAQGLTAPGSNLFRADLSGINLNNAVMHDVNFAQTIAQGARMSGANLSYTDFTLADLRNTDLSNADLSYSNLAGANLTGANLTGANLTGAIMWLSDLNGANIAFARWNHTTCPDGGITQETNRGTIRRPVIQQVCGPIFIPDPSRARVVGPRRGDVGAWTDEGIGNDTQYSREGTGLPSLKN